MIGATAQNATIIGKLKDEARDAADYTSYSESDCYGTEATVLDRVVRELQQL